MFEIESSKLAAERGDQATKTFAQQMVKDHKKDVSEFEKQASKGDDSSV